MLKFEYEYEYRSQIGNVCEFYCEVPKVKNFENSFEKFDFFLQLKGELHNLKKQQAYPVMVELKLLEYSHLSPSDIHEKQPVICFFEDLACFDQLQQLVNNYKKCHFEYEYEESMEMAENIKFKKYHIENQVHALIQLNEKNSLQFNRDAQIKNVQVVYYNSELSSWSNDKGRDLKYVSWVKSAKIWIPILVKSHRWRAIMLLNIFYNELMQYNIL